MISKMLSNCINVMSNDPIRSVFLCVPPRRKPHVARLMYQGFIKGQNGPCPPKRIHTSSTKRMNNTFNTKKMNNVDRVSNLNDVGDILFHKNNK